MVYIKNLISAHEGNMSVKSEKPYFALDSTLNIAEETCFL